MIKVGINGFGRIGRFVFPRCNEKKRYSNRRYQRPLPGRLLAYMLKV